MIHKPNKSPSDPLSFRPISLLSVISKTFEKILAARLSAFAEERNIFPTTQAGFRRGRGVTDALMRLISETTVALNSGNCVLASFFDIERAFDKVWHEGLYYKLLKLNIPLSLVRTIKALLSNRSSKVRVQNELSDPFIPVSGVPQGSSLSPVLYLLYCHDLPGPVSPHLSLSQFADDTAYWCAASSAASAFRRLQVQISRFEKWLSRWRVRPNAAKTQLILFVHRSRTNNGKFQPEHLSLHLWGAQVTTQKQARYLGVQFDHILNWGPHVNNILVSARRRMNLLVLIRGKFQGCSFKTLLYTYKAFIRPVFDFAAGALAPVLKSHIQRYASLERRILRRIGRLRPCTKNEEVFTLLNVKSVPITLRLNDLHINYIQSLLPSNKDDVLDAMSTDLSYPLKPKFKYPLPFPPRP
jgi:hypothetical protein